MKRQAAMSSGISSLEYGTPHPFNPIQEPSKSFNFILNRDGYDFGTKPRIHAIYKSKPHNDVIHGHRIFVLGAKTSFAITSGVAHAVWIPRANLAFHHVSSFVVQDVLHIHFFTK